MAIDMLIATNNETGETAEVPAALPAAFYARMKLNGDREFREVAESANAGDEFAGALMVQISNAAHFVECARHANVKGVKLPAKLTFGAVYEFALEWSVSLDRAVEPSGDDENPTGTTAAAS